VLSTKDEHTLGDDDLNTNPDAIIITGAEEYLINLVHHCLETRQTRSK
jgi:hypothetical protein